MEVCRYVRISSGVTQLAMKVPPQIRADEGQEPTNNYVAPVLCMSSM